jgi:hypothetical protein
MASEHTPARTGTPKDTKSVLYEAAVQAVQDRTQAAKARAEQVPRKKRRVLMPVLTIIGLAGAVLLAVQPTWLAGPTAVPEETPAVAAASLRVVLVRERDLLLRYLRRNGTLPLTLRAAGSSSTGLEYVHQGNEFSVTGHTGDSVITIRSSDSVVAFLGDSFDRLRQRRVP